jgi:hypothetical protein
MKERNGFVTNSSSASYIISKKKITTEQVQDIYDHAKFAFYKSSDGSNYSNAWHIEEDELYIQVSTSMDNFNMYQYLLDIGISEEVIVDDD